MTGSCTKNTGKLFSLSVQFFEMVPVRRIQWQNADIGIGDLALEAQRYILSSTVNSQLCLEYPPSIQYQRAFIKKILNTLEGCGVEICDELYETYTKLLEHRDVEEESLCYKTYTVDEDVRITLQESVNIISDGTTGLSTWQAAQHLAEWAVQNKKLLENRNILELGCGLGLSGITVCHTCCVNSYTFSDCHTQVLDCLARNVEQNFWDAKLAKTRRVNTGETVGTLHTQHLKDDLTVCDKDTIRSSDTLTYKDRADVQPLPDCDTSDSALDCALNDLEIDCDTCGTEGSVQDSLQCEHKEIKDVIGTDGVVNTWTGVKKFDVNKPCFCKSLQAILLDWENLDSNLVKQLSNTDVILAADVVYDTRVIPGLVSVLKIFLGNKSTHTVAYIASTIRNEDTRDQFLVTLGNEGLKYDEVDPPTLQLFHYDRSLPIEIIRVTATS